MEGIDEIRRLRRACEDMELENRELLAKYTDEQLSDMFNGIGPQGFPGWLRKALDALHPSLKPVAMIHDVEWSESDGRRETFDESNERAGTGSLSPARASAGGGRDATRSCGTRSSSRASARPSASARSTRPTRRG